MDLEEEVILSSIEEFDEGDLDDIAHSADHSRAVRVAAMQEIARRAGDEPLDEMAAWNRIVAGKAAHKQRSAERAGQRKALKQQLQDIAGQISVAYKTALVGDDWDAAVTAYQEVLKLRDRENEIEIGLGLKKKRVATDASRDSAETALRALRKAKISEADALEARQQEWLAEERRRDNADKMPRRPPAYMKDSIQRPPSPPTES